METELKPVGDRELWIAYRVGSDWQLPILCDPYSEDGPLPTHYAIRPAISLLAEPHAALEAHMRKHDLAGSKNYWVIPKDSLDRLARKAPGITPAYYYRWSGESSETAESKETESLTQETLPAYEFLRYVANKSAIEFSVVKLVWVECQRHAVDWLINKQKPLRFSFMNIFPVPLRTNWKEIMLARHPQCAPIFRKPEEERLPLLHKTGFIEDLGAADLAAVDGKRRFFYWTLECSPTEYWTQCVREAESTRRGVRGDTRYTTYYEGRLKESLPNLLVIFGRWLRQMCIPVGRVGESAVSGHPILLPARKVGVLPKRRDDDMAPLMVSDNEVALKPGKHDRLEEKITRMLSLPSVSPGAEDVRGHEEWDEVGEPGDGPD